MKGPEDAHAFLGSVDRSAGRDTWVHRLDPRVKLLSVLLYTLVVISFGKYAVAPLLPFVLFPVVLVRAGRVPVRPLLLRLLLLLPFALPAAAFNPFLDRAPLVRAGGIVLTGGMVSFASILLRYVLTAGAVLALLGTTGIGNLCAALGRLGLPRVLVMQLFFTYRYLHVLLAEGGRMLRARGLRAFHGGGRGLRASVALLGTLLLRSLDRAHRIHAAMVDRGFDGRFPLPRKPGLAAADLVFLAGTTGFFLLARRVDLSRALGEWILGGGG